MKNPKSMKFEAGIRSLFQTVRGCTDMVRAAKECREFLLYQENARRKALVAAREYAWSGQK